MGLDFVDLGYLFIGATITARLVVSCQSILIVILAVNELNIYIVVSIRASNKIGVRYLMGSFGLVFDWLK